MTPLSRRLALRALGLGFPASALAADKLKRDMAINPRIACEPEVATGAQPVTFTNFAEWLSRCGHEKLKREATRIDGFDGDIIDMHFPMVTKVRMQRQRNYERLLEARKRWFAEQLGLKGIVEWFI